MKKILILMTAMFCSINGFAQFTVYTPCNPRSKTRSDAYSPFTIYEPVSGTTPPVVQQPQTKSQIITLRGYYKKVNEGWKCTPIRVAVIGDEITLVAVKNSNSWMSSKSAVYQVGWSDPDIIKDNFNFKAYCYGIGMIYF